MRIARLLTPWLSTVVLLVLAATAAAEDRGLPGAAEFSKEQRLALVIGNGSYAEAPLRNPVNDAKAMTRTLKKLGFQVIELNDATGKQMAQGILDFGEKLKRGGVGLFYYAGHGVQVRGQNYLVPVDARINSEASIRFEAIAVESVTEQMGEASNRVNLVILDACRNNPFERRLRGGPRGLAAMDAARGTLVAYATAPGSTAADGDGENGLYTEELLRTLREPGLKVEEVFKRVRSGVVQKTNGMQTPWESSSLTGDFVFNQTIIIQPPPPAAPAPPAAVAALPPNGGGGDREVIFWDSVRNSSEAADYEEYLRLYPTGTFADLARLRIERLSKKAEKREPPQATAPPAAAAPQPAPAPAAAAAATAEEFSGAFLAKKRVNVRTAPTPGAKVIQTLEPGARVSATGRLADKGWTRIAVKDGSQEGWVTSNLLETEQEADARKAEEEEAVQRKAEAEREAVQRREAKRADDARLTAEAERNFREAQRQIQSQRELAAQQKREQERKKRGGDAVANQRSLAPEASASAAPPPPAEQPQKPGAFRRFFNDVKDTFSGSKSAPAGAPSGGN
jgi:uncharacterized caspase-like protein